MYQQSTAPELDPATEPFPPVSRLARRRTRFAAGALLVLVAAAGAACGEKDDDPDASAASTAPEPAPSTEAAAPPATTAVPVPSTTEAAPPATFAMPDFVGLDLQSAQNLVQTQGVWLSVSHDLLGSRNQVVDSNWIVCTQNIPAGEQVTTSAEGEIDFGVVKREERCP